MVGLLAGALNPEGPLAREIDELWDFMLWFGVAVFVLFAALLVLGLRRRGASGDEEEPRSTRTWLVWGGVALPAVGVLAVLVFTIATMRELPDRLPGASEEGLTIEVVGHQWFWEFRYPDAGVVTANELHIPTGREVLLVMQSADVIHSFWVPALAGKKDVMPDYLTTQVLVADEPGRYRGHCAEFCGLQHALMRLEVVAEEPGDFDTWLAQQARPAAEPATSLQAEGFDVFLSAGCAECHTIRGTSAGGDVGPDLTHLAGRRTIGDTILESTGEDLRAWIRDPHAFKEGVEMPAFDLGEEELAALVAYLESLE